MKEQGKGNFSKSFAKSATLRKKIGERGQNLAQIKVCFIKLSY